MGYDKVSGIPAELNALPGTIEPIATKAEAAAVKGYTLAELLQMDEAELGEQFLFGEYLLKRGLAVVVGGSDTGKSTLLRQLCISIASGNDFLGWQFKGNRRRAIYFSSEDDMKLTARVVQIYNRSMMVNGEAAKNLKFVFDWNSDNIVEIAEAMMKESAADLIVVDAFGDAFNGKNMNDNKEVRKFYEPFKKLAATYDSLIIFNHHTGKKTAAYSPDKDNALGSQAIEATPRLAVELRQDPYDKEKIHLCIVKANYLPPKEKSQSFVLRRDNNMVFYNTGERVYFEELAKVADKTERKPKQPGNIKDEVHRNFISRVMIGTVNQTDLKTLIAAEFEVSQRQAALFVAYYESTKRWITREDGKNKYNSVYYRSLLTPCF